jgi:O-acetylhomoserine (thiol)-lyase
MLTEVLRDCTTIAMVGASPKWQRPSFFAMKYLQQKGYRVVPINPVVEPGEIILGEPCYPSLEDLPEALAKEIVMVDIFRNSAAAAAITDDAIATLLPHGALKCVWMQLGVRNDEAAARAEAAGLQVVMDRCPKIEFSRLFGELGTHGIDTGVISSRRRYPGRPPPAGRRPCLELGASAGFETRAIHAGAAPDPASGARGTPIHQSTAFVFDDVDHAASLFNLQTFGAETAFWDSFSSCLSRACLGNLIVFYLKNSSYNI